MLCKLVRGRTFFRLTHTENGHLCPLLCPFFEVPPRTNMHRKILKSLLVNVHMYSNKSKVVELLYYSLLNMCRSWSCKSCKRRSWARRSPPTKGSSSRSKLSTSPSAPTETSTASNWWTRRCHYIRSCLHSTLYPTLYRYIHTYMVSYLSYTLKVLGDVIHFH